jgi:tryptophan synthase alpha chain
MSKIEEVFAQKKKVFIPFVTAGDPSLAKTEELIYAMEKQGAGIIEIGIPFSDPVAEGPVIQEADNRALSKGCKIDDVFNMLRKARAKTQVPLVFLTYINPIVVYGMDKFLKQAQEVGIAGIIVPDVPYEEKGMLVGPFAKYGIDLISMIAPTSADRIQMIAKEAKGYVYLVSSLGVTGVRSNITTDIGAMVAQVRKVTKTPVAVGFGIATPDQAYAMAKASDGAIVGSAIVKIIAKYGEASVEPVEKYVATMVAAVEKAKK